MHPARFAICALWLAVAPALAGPERDAAWERLLIERESPEAFAKAIDQAREAGVSQQGLLEARFLFHVDRNEDDLIAALAPEFLKRRDEFKPGDSDIFATTEDWLAVVEYAQALAALLRDDPVAFKKHITEAFWLSPGQGAAFAPHIERLRLNEAMKEVRINFSARLAPLDGGDVGPISRFNEGTAATLIHFWSPWSRECEAMLPDFVATCMELAKHNIAILSILPEQHADAITDARKMLVPLGAKPPGAWLIDRPHEPLAALLRVTNLPSFVLLDQEGAVLFNGRPGDPELWKKLESIAPGFKRPVMSALD